MNVLIVVPAFNLESAIGPLLEGIGEAVPGAVSLVIDDGSDDDTAGAAGRVEGTVVLRHERNRGKGAALRTGFAYALREGFEGVITLDGDGQHPPALIPAFLERRQKSGADLIVGARERRHTDMPLHRRLSNRITSRMASRLAGCELPDSQSGYRFVSRTVLENVKLTTSNYETETELLIRAARAGFMIDSVPIPTVYADETSHIDLWRDTVRFLKLLIRLRGELGK